jgi:hypothetical protein
MGQAFAALASCDELALEPLLRSIQSVLTDFPIREGLPSHLCPQLFGTLMAVKIVLLTAFSMHWRVTVCVEHFILLLSTWSRFIKRTGYPLYKIGFGRRK